MSLAPDALPVPEPPEPVPVPVPVPVAPPVTPILPEASPAMPPAPVSVQAPDVAAAGAQDIARSRKLGSLEEQTAREQGAANARKAEIEADAAQRAVRIAEVHEQMVARAMARADRLDSEAIARHERAVQALERQPFTDFWSSQSDGNKMRARLALSLGAFGAGLSAAGGVNTGNLAAEQLQKSIDNDFARQKAVFERLKDREAIARTGIHDARDARKALMDGVEASHQAALKRLEAEAVAHLKAQGKTDAEIATNQVIIELRKKRLASESATRERIVKETTEAMKAPLERGKLVADTSEAYAKAEEARADAELKRSLAQGGGAAGKIPEWEAKEASFGERMLQDYNILRSVPPISDAGRKLIREYAAKEAFLDKNPGINYLAQKAGLYDTLESQLSDSDRTAFQAGRSLAQAQLRGESGAVINIGEYVMWDRVNLPVVGEKPADIERKYKRLEAQIRGHLRAGRRLLEGDVAAPPPGPVGKLTDDQLNRLSIAYPGGTVATMIQEERARRAKAAAPALPPGWKQVQ
jgi:hypothetical protein